MEVAGSHPILLEPDYEVLRVRCAGCDKVIIEARMYTTASSIARKIAEHLRLYLSEQP